MPGLTDQGFVARREPEIQELIEQRLNDDEEVGGFNFRAGPIQQLIGVLAELLAEQWEAMEGTYASQYSAAGGISLDRVSGLTGTDRRQATRSSVLATVTLDAGATLPAGSVAAVLDVPDAQFASVSEITNAGASSAMFAILFEGVATGPVAAPAGTLTEIVGAVSGWTAVTNAADADLGLVIADDVELRTTRTTELQGSGSANVDAITAAVSQVEGVLSSRTYQNVLQTVVSGRPAHSIEVVVWDGLALAADDDAIAQAIWDEIAAGIEPHGVGESGSATDGTGASSTIPFTRATTVPIFVDLTVVLIPGVLLASVEDDIKEAVAARGQLYRVGEDVYASQLSCVVQALDFVEAVATLTVGIAPAPVGLSVVISEDGIATIAEGDVTPTV